MISKAKLNRLKRKQKIKLKEAHYNQFLKNVHETGEIYNLQNEYLASNKFLTSFDWKLLRMKAIKKYGNKCQCCGNSPSTGAVINVDHIKPRKYYPQLALDINNLQILCSDCNHGKSNWDQTNWRLNLDHLQ